MTISSALQISLISGREWSSLFSRFELIQNRFTGKVWSCACTIGDASSLNMPRRMSDLSDISFVGETLFQPDVASLDGLRSHLKED